MRANKSSKNFSFLKILDRLRIGLGMARIRKWRKWIYRKLEKGQNGL